MTLATGLVFGLPAIRTEERQVGRRKKTSTSSVLVIPQLAVSVVLLTGAVPHI